MSRPADATPDDPLSTPAQYVRGVGPDRAELLKKLGIETAADLLFFFPRTYEDLSDQRRIANLTAGDLQTVVGEVVEIEGRTTSGGRNLIRVVISDGSGVVEGVWFNQPFMARKFHYGQRVAFSGKPQWRFDHWQINKPRVRYLDRADPNQPDSSIVPVYPLTEGLWPDQMRRIQRRVVETFANCVAEVIPAELRQRRGLIGIDQALRQIHVPKSLAEVRQARRRLVYEEFLVLQSALALRRRDNQLNASAPVLPVTRTMDERIRRLFPFTLTGDQNRAIADICRDMARDRPMQRLLQADVGAGKTAVAVYALLLAVAHKHQAALMAPTEVLARQHWRTLQRYLAHSRVRREILTGGLPDRERRRILGEIRMGAVDLVVGTQALIQKNVEFARLGLVVIDEQHRFGVSQREKIRRLGVDPHYLVMTATPIPRTVALTVFGDLDVSVIREMPPGRSPVRTRWVTESKRAALEGYLRRQLDAGRQLYVVCPLVEESATSDIAAAEQTYDRLRSGPFANYRVGLLHGRMSEQAKDQAMTAFESGSIQVLVCTSVIEVGVDVANATLMVIEHAERFGLSQLHQFRGRISRGAVAGECYFFATADSDDSKTRLRYFEKTNDGFALAEHDARLRGMGELFGTRQHGLGELRLAHPITDAELLQLARQDAFALVAADPALRQEDHQPLRDAVLSRYGQTLDLVEIG